MSFHAVFVLSSWKNGTIKCNQLKHRMYTYATVGLVLITSCTNIGTSSYFLTLKVFFHSKQIICSAAGFGFNSQGGIWAPHGITVRTQQWQHRDFHEHSVKTDYTSLGLLGLLLPRREGACKYDASVRIWVNIPAFCAETRPPDFRLSILLICSASSCNRTTF